MNVKSRNHLKNIIQTGEAEVVSDIQLKVDTGVVHRRNIEVIVRDLNDFCGYLFNIKLLNLKHIIRFLNIFRDFKLHDFRFLVRKTSASVPIG
jgi:hypothetical protein